jgi:hypothetical protein
MHRLRIEPGEVDAARDDAQPVLLDAIGLGRGPADELGNGDDAGPAP